MPKLLFSAATGIDPKAHAPAARGLRRLRVAALRIVAVLFGMGSAACALVLVAGPIAARWPHAVTRAHLSIWQLVVFALFGYTCARTSIHLWRLQRIAGVVALGLCASSLLANYIGPLKGTQSVDLDIIPLLLLAFGWRELK